MRNQTPASKFAKLASGILRRNKDDDFSRLAYLLLFIEKASGNEKHKEEVINNWPTHTSAGELEGQDLIRLVELAKLKREDKSPEAEEEEEELKARNNDFTRPFDCKVVSLRAETLTRALCLGSVPDAKSYARYVACLTLAGLRLDFKRRTSQEAQLQGNYKPLCVIVPKDWKAPLNVATIKAAKALRKKAQKIELMKNQKKIEEREIIRKHLKANGAQEREANLLAENERLRAELAQAKAEKEAPSGNVIAFKPKSKGRNPRAYFWAVLRNNLQKHGGKFRLRLSDFAKYKFDSEEEFKACLNDFSFPQSKKGDAITLIYGETSLELARDVIAKGWKDDAILGLTK